MLIVIKVETTTMEIMNAVLAKKEITITGEAVNLYPEDDYIKELEEKSIEISKDFSTLGFLGHNVEPISKVIENPNAFKSKYKTN